jgi:hypothetical protein
MAGRLLARVTGRRLPPRVYLHIGAMKTGTTFLQDLLEANREDLKKAGYLFPGEQFSDISHAVRDLLFSSEDAEVQSQTRGKWARLVDEIVSFDGKAAIVSMEFLSFADAEGAARVVESFPGHEVHVILTVRDAERAIPAQWQTSMRNGSKVTLPKFVQGTRQVVQGKDSNAKGARIFQRTQGIPRMLETWTPLVGQKRLHVITVPPSGSDPALLWERFAKVVGVRPKAAGVLPSAANPSLGHPSSELLRRVNKELGDVPTVDYWVVIKSQLARRVLGGRAGEERPVRLHRPGVSLAREWNDVVRQAISQHGVRLVGSLDELPVDPPDPDLPKQLYRPGEHELLAAAGTAYSGMTDFREELAAQAGEPLPQRTSRPDWTATEEPVDAAVADIVALVRECMELRRVVAAQADQDQVS